MSTCQILSRYGGKRFNRLRTLHKLFASKQIHSTTTNTTNSFMYQQLPALSPKTTYLTTIPNNRRRLLNLEVHRCTSHHGYCTGESENTEIDIEYDEMVSFMKEDATVVIDVREEEEIEAFGAVPKAVNIPMGDLVQALELSPRQYRALYKCDPPDQDSSRLIFLCAKGIRSHAAVMLARELGFHKSCHLAGGYQHWQECQDEKGS